MENLGVKVISYSYPGGQKACKTGTTYSESQKVGSIRIIIKINKNNAACPMLLIQTQDLL